MENSHIQWTDHTFNPWEGCTKVSPGCAHCYAEARNQRWSGGKNWGKGAPRRRTSASNWKGPVKWNREVFVKCDECGVAMPTGGRPENFLESKCRGNCTDKCGGTFRPQRPRVFCASLADWLDEEVEIRWLADLMRLVVETPNLDWLLLTKRPENWLARITGAFVETACGSMDADEMMMEWVNGRPPHNVWVGTTVEDGERARERHPLLMSIPARVHFWSAEPLLSFVMPADPWKKSGAPDWVICGGESGPKARAMDEEWVRTLEQHCRLFGPAFFMKQMGGSRDARGELAQIPEDLRIRQFPQLTAAKD